MLCKSRIVRVKELAERLGISRATLWRWERKGRVPRKRHLGPNTVGWLESDIEVWFSTTAPADAASSDQILRPRDE